MIRTLGVCLVVSAVFGTAIVSCSAGGGASPGNRSSSSGSGPGSGSGGPASGSGGFTASGSGGTGNLIVTGGSGGGSGGGCQTFSINWEPKIPTVFMLVDRSGSMFTVPNGATETPWDTMRNGALQVIQELQSEVRIGFGAYAAFDNDISQGVACPAHVTNQVINLPTVPADLNNYDAIANVYLNLNMPGGGKINTGSSFALDAVADLLWNDPTDGEKYILFVTDGEPDYCDDPHRPCPIDSVAWTIQRLRAGIKRDGTSGLPPIGTIVFGLAYESSGAALPFAQQALKMFATAGAGEPVPFLRTEDGMQVFDATRLYNECFNGVDGWKADFAVSGKTAPDTLTTYSETGGPAEPYTPEAGDQAALANQIRQALQGVKSCTFDISEGNIEIDWQRADLGSVASILINGAGIPYDATNGWHMTSPTTVQLEGEACDTWRQPGESTIDFNFPCEIIVTVF